MGQDMHESESARKQTYEYQRSNGDGDGDGRVSNGLSALLFTKYHGKRGRFPMI